MGLVKDIRDIKILAKNCLKDKWNNKDNYFEIQISDKCSFCYETKWNNSEDNIDCSTCLIPNVLCNGLFKTSLIDVLHYKSRKKGYKYLDKIYYMNVFKLFVKCLEDLSETGKISEENLCNVKEFIDSYKLEVNS